ncbi:MAG: GTP-binding protein [Pirellulaceae bacterium]
MAAGRVLGTLMQMGHALTINANIDPELAELLATELDLELEFKHPQSLEEGIIDTIDQHVDTDEQLISRPPVVTFLGHVDHGKTSLLDYLIGTSVVTGEAGGITQHIRAYQVEKDGRIISFVDTPGHEAFTEMRARGANVTDIAVLVIAADDGIMPQTEEAISHAKAAEVPIVVALNKIDLQGVDENRILTQMTEHGLTPSEWGGDVEVVRTSHYRPRDGRVARNAAYRSRTARLQGQSQSSCGRGLPGSRTAVGQGEWSPSSSCKMVRSNLEILCCAAPVTDASKPCTIPSTRACKSKRLALPCRSTSPASTWPLRGDRFYVLDNIGQARELAETRSDKSRTIAVGNPCPRCPLKLSRLAAVRQARQGRRHGRAEFDHSRATRG